MRRFPLLPKRYKPVWLILEALHMPKLTVAVPKYRKHRASGQAIVTVNGRDHYLRPPTSKASKLEYDRLVNQWLTTNRDPR